MIDPVLDLTVRAGLAVLFGLAATHKLRDLRGFTVTLGEYRVLPAALVPLAAAVVVASELALAVALALPGARRAALAAAAGQLLVYAGAVGVNLLRGRRHIDCGCAGPAARRPIGGGLVVRNVAIAAVALAMLAPLSARRLVWLDALTVVAATTTLAALYAAVDRMLADAPALVRLRGRA